MFSATNYRHCMLLMAALFFMGDINVAYAIGGDSTDGKWEYSLSPLFLWAQGIQGTSQIGPVTAPLDITFKDALSNLEATFTIHFEMKRDRLTLFGEYQYVNLGPEAEAPNGVTLDIGFKDTIGELGAAYWVHGTERTDWELLGGTRYTKQKLDVSVENGPHLLDVESDWWVGFFGGRMSAALSENWTFIGRVDYGIGSGDTNRIWNFAAMFDYRFKDWGSVFAGYKYMNYDYDNGRTGFDHYGYDASQQGPLLGLTIHW
jgi:predicted porin